MRKQAYSILVHNNPGLLSRMAGLFSRRGYNIESITAGTTADPRFTRITIVASGDEQILSQIEKQVRKMEDVIDIKLLNTTNSVCRELMMIKIRANASQRAEIISVCDRLITSLRAAELNAAIMTGMLADMRREFANPP